MLSPCILLEEVTKVQIMLNSVGLNNKKFSSGSTYMYLVKNYLYSLLERKNEKKKTLKHLRFA